MIRAGGKATIAIVYAMNKDNSNNDVNKIEFLNKIWTNEISTIRCFLIIERQTMSKITFTMKNDAGEDVLYSSKEITTRDYRDYLVLNDSLHIR